MTNPELIKLVQSIERDYGTVACKEAANDPRLEYIHRMYPAESKQPEVARNKTKMKQAQHLLDTLNEPKYKIAKMVHVNSNTFSQLCSSGLLDDELWLAHRQHRFQYRYYRGDKLIAKGTIKQIANKTGKTERQIRYCQLSTYRKYAHAEKYRLIRVRS